MPTYIDYYMVRALQNTAHNELWELDFLGWTVQPFVSITGQGVARRKSHGVGRVEAISSGSEKLAWIYP